MKHVFRKLGLNLILAVVLVMIPAMAAVAQNPEEVPVVKKVLFIGDSMTGWLSERLNAYGKENGFEVATVVWDGSTIKKWGSSPKLSTIVKEQDPEAVFVSLGMNELFESNPEGRLDSSLRSILNAIGDLPVVWIGPPSWPGNEGKGDKLNEWLESKLGTGHYFRSDTLSMPRQSRTNPHPTREGMILWMDSALEWLQSDGAVRLPGAVIPAGEKMSRGKVFIYRRMKEAL